MTLVQHRPCHTVFLFISIHLAIPHCEECNLLLISFDLVDPVVPPLIASYCSSLPGIPAKTGPLCRQSWNNEAKNRPIDSKTGSNIFTISDMTNNFWPRTCDHFCSTNINLAGKHRTVEFVDLVWPSRGMQRLTTRKHLGDVAWVAEESKRENVKRINMNAGKNLHAQYTCTI